MAGIDGDLLERRGPLVAVALLLALLFSLTNLPWTLDDYDQAKQAFTSFEMTEAGHWFYQHTPNGKIATKPPLVGWISAGLHAVTRSWTLAWRLPSFTAAILLAILLWRAARERYGALAALLALAAFGLNLLAPRLATLVRTDMPLALVIFALGLVIWRKIAAAEPWSRGDRWLIFALLTASMLIKGPIVYAFLLPGIVAYQLWARKRAPQTSAWCGWWPWLASLAVFLLWAAGGIAWMPGFYEQVVLREFAGRFGETVHRPQPFYFYLPHLLHKFAPWSVLLLALAWWRRREKFSPEVCWLVCWSLGGLLVMSLIPSKRVDRIFPVLPPLCLLLAAWTDARARRWSIWALVLAGIFTGGYAAQKIIVSYRHDDGALVRFSENVRARTERYEVIGGKEEGLLLYLRRTQFMKTDDALTRWRRGEIDALVAPEEEIAGLLAALPEARASELAGEITVNGRPRRYRLLQRNH